MAEMEKIYCMDRPDNSQLLAELINAKGGDNSMWMNNPFMYLIWLAFFGGNGFGYGRGGANPEINGRIDAVESQLRDNHNNELALNAIMGNGKALSELAGNLNVGVASLDAAIDRVNAGIAKIAGEVGISAERVINAIGNGNLNIIQQFKDCCCETQKEITKMGYESQIATLNQTNAIGKEIADARSDIHAKLDEINFNSQKQTAEIINAGNANTQRIVDTLNQHWTAELSQSLQDAKFEISQLTQTQKLIDTLKQ